MSLDDVGGRKVVMVAMVLVTGTAIELLSPKGLSTTFSYFLLGALGVFVGGNSVEHFSRAYGAQGSDVPDSGEVGADAGDRETAVYPNHTEQLDRLEEALRANIAGVGFLVSYVKKANGDQS